MSRYDEYIDIIEKLFEENKAKDAETFMINALYEAREEKDRSFELQMLNELIGYYRQTSEKDKLIGVMEDSLRLADDMGIAQLQEGKIPYATTVLNIANGYRSIGELDRSEKYYNIVSTVYRELLDENDMLYAGLHNNLSLLYQERNDYARAMESLRKALNIVCEHNAEFEIAVTYANLANTAVLKEQSEGGNDFAVARKYANEAIKRFEARNTLDSHYCAALSALGMCCYYEGHYKQAWELFTRGMDIVEKNVGKNAQYVKLRENRDMCREKFISGLQLSRKYFEEYGKEMIERNFPEYASQMVVGLVGEGSDCYGFDDDFSTDHDYGPDFCIWLPDDVYDEVGEKLKSLYNELPKEYMGYERTTTAQGAGRRGVLRVSDFYRKFLGTDKYEEIDWGNVKEYNFAAVTNGEIYSDSEGDFTKLREKLKKGFPDDILRLKLAEDLAIISQTGQYNYARMLKRGDRISADMMLSDCIKQLMIYAHHFKNCFPPHDKWLYKSFGRVADGTDLPGYVVKLHDSFAMNDEKSLEYVSDIMEQVGEYIAGQMYNYDYISDISTYLGNHADELIRKSKYVCLSDKELVDKIARIEFEAFDKVKNEGGRASCQNDWPTFSVMRKSQYLTWNHIMLVQYLYDFTVEFERGHNLITEKYGRMMESTAPEKYAEIADSFPEIVPQKKAIIEQIVAIQISMVEEFGKKYPKLAGNARSFHTYEDTFVNTSYETYLRGEISTYSDKMLQLYAGYVISSVRNGVNIAYETIRNTAEMYGYDDLDSFAKRAE